jgi:large conductance mechanosensitive channel
MLAMLKEFREFVARGNVIDMAVGIIIGVAFGKIVTSLVNDMIMPPIGLALGRVDFNSLFIPLKGSYPTIAAAKAAGAPTVNYGVFINSILEFLIIAFAVFILVKAVNRIKRKPEEKPADTTECTYCCSKIPIKATRCPACTSQLNPAST